MVALKRDKFDEPNEFVNLADELDDRGVSPGVVLAKCAEAMAEMVVFGGIEKTGIDPAKLDSLMLDSLAVIALVNFRDFLRNEMCRVYAVVNERHEHEERSQ